MSTRCLRSLCDLPFQQILEQLDGDAWESISDEWDRYVNEMVPSPENDERRYDECTKRKKDVMAPPSKVPDDNNACAVMTFLWSKEAEHAQVSHHLVNL